MARLEGELGAFWHSLWHPTHRVFRFYDGHRLLSVGCFECRISFYGRVKGFRRWHMR